jgi:hypothetical protein
MRETTEGKTAGGRPADPAFAHRAQPYSAPSTLWLEGAELHVEKGRSKQVFPLGALESIRLMYAPRNIARRAFACHIRARDGRSVRFTNLDWTSLIEVELVDAAYHAFATALVRRAAGLTPDIRLEAGCGWLRYRLTQGVGFALIGALIISALYYGGFPDHAGFIRASATAADRQAGNLLAGGSLALAAYLGFWLNAFLVRNRPQRFTGAAIPPAVLPAIR